jgi:hypothetical protein
MLAENGAIEKGKLEAQTAEKLPESGTCTTARSCRGLELTLFSSLAGGLGEIKWR